MFVLFVARSSVCLLVYLLLYLGLSFYHLALCLLSIIVLCFLFSCCLLFLCLLLLLPVIPISLPVFLNVTLHVCLLFCRTVCFTLFLVSRSLCLSVYVFHTLECCWDVKLPTNISLTLSVYVCLSVCLSRCDRNALFLLSRSFSLSLSTSISRFGCLSQ